MNKVRSVCGTTSFTQFHFYSTALRAVMRNSTTNLITVDPRMMCWERSLHCMISSSWGPCEKLLLSGKSMLLKNLFWFYLAYTGPIVAEWLSELASISMRLKVKSVHFKSSKYVQLHSLHFIRSLHYAFAYTLCICQLFNFSIFKKNFTLRESTVT
jgi:hypothetical protein